MDDPGFESSQGREVTLFSDTLRPVWGPTHLVIQWVFLKSNTDESTGKLGGRNTAIEKIPYKM